MKIHPLVKMPHVLYMIGVAVAALRVNAVTISPSGHDDSVRINRAIRSGAAEIRLSPGTFLIKHAIILGGARGAANGLTIRGAGRGRTTLFSTIGRETVPEDPDYLKQSVVLWKGNFGSYGVLESCPQNPCYVRGSREIRVADSDQFAVGDSLVLITGNATVGAIDGPAELHTVAAKSGSALTLSQPLEHDLHSDRWVVWHAQPIRDLVIADLTIAGTAAVGIELMAAERCVIERVELREFNSAVGINLDRAGNDNVIRDVTVAGRRLPEVWGLSLESQNHSLIENSVVTVGQAHGQFGNPISINCATNATVRDVVVYGATNGVGLISTGYFEPQTGYRVNGSNLTIDGVDFSGNDVGIRLSDTDDVIITNSRLRRNNLGISIYGTSSRALVSNVSLDHNAQWGIAFEAGAEKTAANKVNGCQYVPSPASLGAVSPSSAAITSCP